MSEEVTGGGVECVKCVVIAYCVAVLLQHVVAVWLQCVVAVCCSELQSVAVCYCSLLQCDVAVCCSHG